MKTRNLTIYLLALFLNNLPQIVDATTKPSMEQLVIRNIANFANFNRGEFATNWSQLTNYLDFDRINNQTLANTTASPIQSNYVFIPFNLQMMDGEGRVLLARATPLTNDDIAGRYIVYEKKGVVSSTWIKEEEFQKTLMQAGVTELPNPEPFNSPSNQIPPAGISESRQEPQATTPVAVSNTAPDHQGTASVPDKNIIPKPLPTGEPNTNSASPESAATPSLKWLMLGVVVVLGGGFVFLLFRNKSR